MKRSSGLALKSMAAAVTLAFAAGAVQAAQPSNAEMMTELKRLSERIQKLEKENAELRTRQQTPATPGSDLETRLKALEARNAQIDEALSKDTISEQEPELTARLKGAEYTSLDIQKQAKVIDSIQGFSAGASLTTVGQRLSGIPAKVGTLVNYRADITVTTPTISTGNIDSRLFGHFRIGQGKGVSEKLTSFVGPNASSFQLGSVIEPDSSAVMLAQAWYQADIPLPLDGVKALSRETLTVNFGKMDPFGFFDQNAAANDETRQFLASSFVHNALLDNPLAANVGADGFGFSPGLRLAYFNERAKPENYRLSLGVFGAGEGADFSGSVKSPFVIFQVEASRRLFGGLEGNYRAFVWRNGQAPTFAAGETARHTGFGLNFDQRFDDAITVFGRYGAAGGDRLPFDRTASAGAEIGGGYWRRAADGLGLALGANRTSADFRAQSAALDADGDGNPDYGFTARGWEQAAEIYYRYRVHPGFEITPDFQLVRHPAGNPDGKTVKILGARVQLSY